MKLLLTFFSLASSHLDLAILNHFEELDPLRVAVQWTLKPLQVEAVVLVLALLNLWIVACNVVTSTTLGEFLEIVDLCDWLAPRRRSTILSFLTARWVLFLVSLHQLPQIFMVKVPCEWRDGLFEGRCPSLLE